MAVEEDVHRDTKPDYTPALGYRWLTRLYDPMLSLTMREQTFRPALVRQIARLTPKRVLDLGCGTGSLVMMLAEALPAAAIVGVDADDEVLARARRKATQRALQEVELIRGMADDLPVAAGTQDMVVSSLLFHHLKPGTKVAALSEARRVLRPGGSLQIADWGRGQDPVMRAAFFMVRGLDGFETTRLHAVGGLPDLVQDSGFEEVRVWKRLRTMFGTLDLIEAKRTG